jgi:anhydro-N-acetylmuramic acid kinase
MTNVSLLPSLTELASERPLRALGLMSGTSVDGVDVALIETEGDTVTAFGPVLTVAYDDATRRLIRAAFGSEEQTAATRAAEQAVTDAHAAAVRRWSETSGIALSTLDVVGFHGQTITHRPEKRFTWQLGDGAALARALGVAVIDDLRSADVAAGGQGAPLAPVYHAALTQDLERPVAVVNIGGVANVTWIGADGALLAFDTGPGNGPIDDWCARRAGLRFDSDGALAATGKVNRARVERFSQHRYFGRTPPKSLDRSDFNDSWADGLSAADGAATLTQGTARAIALAARYFPVAVPMGDLWRRGAQSRLAARDCRGNAGTRENGIRSRLGRRCTGGAGIRLHGRAGAARAADQLSHDHGSVAPAHRRAPASAVTEAVIALCCWWRAPAA